MENNLYKLKRAIGSFVMGSAMVVLIVPVIACSSFQKVIVSEKLQEQVEAIDPDLNFLENLPPTPKHTHWEYQLAKGGYSLTEPQLAPGLVYDVRLGTDPGYELSSPVIRENVIIEGSVDVDAAALKQDLSFVVFDTSADLSPFLPATPLNTHWEFSQDGGASWSKEVPVNLKAGQKIKMRLAGDRHLAEGEQADAHMEYSIDGGLTWFREPPLIADADVEIIARLVAKVNYDVDCEITRTITVKETINVAIDLQRMLDETTADTQNQVRGLSEPPDHTFWEYAVNGGSYQKTPPTNLQALDKVAIRLGSEPNYPLKKLLERSGIIVTGIISVDNLAANLSTLKVHPTDSKIALPPAPEHTHWEVSRDQGSFFTKTLPSPNQLHSGDNLAIRLVADEHYQLATPVSRSVIPVTGLVKVPSGLQSDLEKAVVKTVDPTVVNLPPAPANSHWEYRLGAGPYTPQPPWPSQLQAGQKYGIKLVADNNYELAATVHIERENMVVKGVVPISSELVNKVQNHVFTNTVQGIGNFPAAPQHTHWEYQVGNSPFNSQVPQFSTFQPGQKIAVKLVPEGNYVLEQAVQRSNITVSGLIKPDPNLQAQLDQIVVNTENIGQLPVLASPVHTHWEYQVGEEGYVRTVPSFENLRPGENLAIKLVADKNYALDPSQRVERTNIIVQGTAMVHPDLQNQLDQVKIYSTRNTITNLPPAPANTHWEYQVGNEGYSQYKVNPQSLVPGEIVHLKLVANSNYILAPQVAVTTTVQVRGEVTITPDFANELAGVILDNQHGMITNLPTAPDHTHWEYRIGDEDYSSTLPNLDELAPDEKVGVKLVADANYEISVGNEPEVPEINIAGVVTPDPGLRNAISTLVITNSADAQGKIPPAPKHSHWEYQVRNNPYQSEQPDFEKVQPGEQVHIKLVADPYYVLNPQHPLTGGVPITVRGKG